VEAKLVAAVVLAVTENLHLKLLLQVVIILSLVLVDQTLLIMEEDS
jgi:hypothetical protein